MLHVRRTAIARPVVFNSGEFVPKEECIGTALGHTIIYFTICKNKIYNLHIAQNMIIKKKFINYFFFLIKKGREILDKI